MATRINSDYDGYGKMLKEVNELSNQLYRLGYGLNDLEHFGYYSNLIRNEWSNYDSIQSELIELQNKLQNGLKKVLGDVGE